MKLWEMTWQDVERADRSCVVVIPTGSLEQHGPHLPLFTDTLLATAVAKSVEARHADKVLMTPALWLGASGHHLRFPGTLSASFETYEAAICDVVDSLFPHGFYKFYIVNGHGGNAEPNGIALRKLKARYVDCQFGHSGYYAFAADRVKSALEGPIKEIRHACEAEASLMMYLHPELVRPEKLRDDGLTPEPEVVGMVHHFDEITEQGSLGYATHATAEKGKLIFEAAVDGVAKNLLRLAEGYALVGYPARTS